jgi:hypothetical protein
MKTIRFIRLLLVMGCLALGAGSLAVMAQDAGEIPQITVERNADGYVLPTDIPEGVVQVTFNNNSEQSVDATFARLNEGVTPDALMQALGEAGPMGALPLVSLVGAGSVLPGESAEVYVSFAPGEYILLDTGENAPAPVPFAVGDAEGEGAAAPEAAVEVEFYDFAFSIPLELSAGEQLWQVSNLGEQWHEMVIFPIAADASASDIQEIIALATSVDPAVSGPAPAGFVFPISNGETTWVNMNLEAGSYLALCFLPDLLNMESGHAHFQEGMYQILNVA